MRDGLTYSDPALLAARVALARSTGSI